MNNLDSNKKQIEFDKDMYELTEEVLQELSESKYMSQDLRPTTRNERTWTTYNIGMLWVGMVICITGFSFAAALIALGMSPLVALLNVLIGNLIILIPLQLNSHAGTKYGIPFPIISRLAFGRSGAHIPSLIRALVASGWCAIQCWVGGAAISSFIGIFSDSWDVMGKGRFIGFAIFLLLTLYIGFKGPEGIRWLEAIGSPILIFLCVGLLVWVILTGNANGISVGEMFFAKSNAGKIAENGDLLFLFMSGITSNIAVWATLALNIPDFSRYAKSQKSQFRGQVFFMPTSVIIMATIGAMFAKVTEVTMGEAQYDPTQVLITMNNKLLTALVALGIVVATLTTNMAANVVAPANGYANLCPKKISYRTGVIVTCIMCVIFRPWWIFGSAGAFMFAFLGTVGDILGPVAAILVADYYVVKKKRIDVSALYHENNETYEYTRGWNWRGLLAWALASLIPLLDNFGAGGLIVHWMGANSYIVGFCIAFILYIVFMKSEKKSYISEEMFNSISVPFFGDERGKPIKA